MEPVVSANAHLAPHRKFTHGNAIAPFDIIFLILPLLTAVPVPVRAIPLRKPSITPLAVDVLAVLPAGMDERRAGLRLLLINPPALHMKTPATAALLPLGVEALLIELNLPLGWKWTQRAVRPPVLLLNLVSIVPLAPVLVTAICLFLVYLALLIEHLMTIAAQVPQPHTSLVLI